MAQVDFFLKVDGIEGESHDAFHKGEIEIDSWNWGETQTVSKTGGGSGAGKVSMQNFVCSMKQNKASPKLFLANASGDHIKKVVLTCRKAGGKPHTFYKLIMRDVLITSYAVGGGQGDLIASDRITMDFAKIEWEYSEQKADGSPGPAVKTGWDRIMNQVI